MNVAHLVEQKRTRDTQHLTRSVPRADQLRRDLDDYRKNIVINAHDPYTVAQIRNRIEQAEAELAEIEQRIKTIREFRYPTAEQIDRLNGLFTKMCHASASAGVAQGEAEIAEHNERPMAAAEARKRQAEYQAEFVDANRELRRVLEKFGLDPTPLCGRQ